MIIYIIKKCDFSSHLVIVNCYIDMVPFLGKDKGGSVIDNELYLVVLEEMKKVYKYLIYIGAKQEDAEDISQDTIIKVIENYDVIQPNKIKAWMFRVALNQFYNKYRKSKPINHLSEELMATLSDTDKYTNLELKIQIEKTFSKMKEGQKNILILKYYMGMSYKEMSKILDIGEGSIRTLSYRARKEFINLWEDNK